MAVVSKIWMHADNIAGEEPTMTVYAAFKGVGDVQLRGVKIPAEFKAALLELAQAAADTKAAELKASLLGGVEP